MKSDQDSIAQINELFHSRSVAIVGAPRGMKTGMRLIGPNGMGLYCPKTGLSFSPGVSKEPGPVGIDSHSGSRTNILGRLAPRKGIRFSKVISSGNECGLTPKDSQAFVRYMIEVQQECRKPLLVVAIPGHDLNLGEQFCQAGIPFFESAERAMRTYACVFRDQSSLQKQAALR